MRSLLSALRLSISGSCLGESCSRTRPFDSVFSVRQHIALDVVFTLLMPLTEDNARPALNESPFNTPGLQEILKLCWHRDPTHRPPFTKVVRDLEILHRNFGNGYESPKHAPYPLPTESPGSPSPDLRPRPLPPFEGPRSFGSHGRHESQGTKPTSLKGPVLKSPPASSPIVDILQWDATSE